MSRYIIKPDDATESYKIIDTGTTLSTEDKDHEWVASAYTELYALAICRFLNDLAETTMPI